MSKNVAYFGWSGSPIQRANEIFKECVLSLKRVSDVDIYVTTFPDVLEKEVLDVVTPLYVSKKQWENRRLTAKLEKMLEIPFNDGDKFYYCDGDLFFLKDPFKVFDELVNHDMDVFYTTRHYEFTFPVNGGVWGFKYSKDVEKFRKWFVSEVQNPSWGPYVDLRKNHPYVKEFDHKDWWVDQDFLNTIHWNTDSVNEELGLNLNIKNVGYKYNLITEIDSKEEMINTYDPTILHFKNSQGNERWNKKTETK